MKSTVCRVPMLWGPMVWMVVYPGSRKNQDENQIRYFQSWRRAFDFAYAKAREAREAA